MAGQEHGGIPYDPGDRLADRPRHARRSHHHQAPRSGSISGGFTCLGAGSRYTDRPCSDYIGPGGLSAYHPGGDRSAVRRPGLYRPRVGLFHTGPRTAFNPADNCACTGRHHSGLFVGVRTNAGNRRSDCAHSGR
ncbi:hypothetical protein GCM10009741_48350 [Kribbella lupini]|uniref:Uncharacterized protein n=1 Tax=Kribbella lupini TaxID=291602 RepID=A0ABP4M942_9ACTN